MNIDPQLIDHVLPPDHQGYPEHLAAQDREAGALFAAGGSASRSFPSELWIEPKEWEERAAHNDEMKTWPLNYRSRFTNQDPTHECTCHSLDTNFEIARNRARAVSFASGPKANFRYEESALIGDVFFSCMYPYNKANPRIWGGANVRQVLEIVVAEGFMPDQIQPKDYGFKHTMPGTMGKGNSNQSSGKWIAYNAMPEGWRETAKHFKPKEVVYPESWEQAMCLILHGYAVSVGRNGHAVPESAILFDKQLVAYIDSYNVVRYDSFRTFKSCAASGSFSIISTTVPDDWSKPAG